MLNFQATPLSLAFYIVALSLGLVLIKELFIKRVFCGETEAELYKAQKNSQQPESNSITLTYKYKVDNSEYFYEVIKKTESNDLNVQKIQLWYIPEIPEYSRPATPQSSYSMISLVGMFFLILTFATR